MTIDADALAAWLLGCIADDEEAARSGHVPPWLLTEVTAEWYDPADDLHAGLDDLHDATRTVRQVLTLAAVALRPRILAECAAKRAIVAEETGKRTVTADGGPLRVEWRTGTAGGVHVNGEWMTTTDFYQWFTEAGTPSRVLRSLGTAYADRPGWQEEWRP